MRACVVPIRRAVRNSAPPDWSKQPETALPLPAPTLIQPHQGLGRPAGTQASPSAKRPAEGCRHRAAAKTAAKPRARMAAAIQTGGRPGRLFSLAATRARAGVIAAERETELRHEPNGRLRSVRRRHGAVRDRVIRVGKYSCAPALRGAGGEVVVSQEGCSGSTDGRQAGRAGLIDGGGMA